jgi:hypothetical protein
MRASDSWTPSAIAEQTRNPFGLRILFDNHGSRSFAGEHTSAQATVAYIERIAIKQ